MDDAFDGDAPLDRFAVFADIPTRDLATVRQMLAQQIHVVRAHGAGRYFDAVDALGLGRTEAHYEGQTALEWNLAADPTDDGSYGFELATDGALTEIDLRPCIRSLARELAEGTSPRAVSARFHNTLAAATVAAVREVLRATGPLPVALTGGVFQNARLAESVTRMLGPSVPVLRHGTVPPGDGGIALGQAVIANAVLL